jgi:hypothetical protein
LFAGPARDDHRGIVAFIQQETRKKRVFMPGLAINLRNCLNILSRLAVLNCQAFCRRLRNDSSFSFLDAGIKADLLMMCYKNTTVLCHFCDFLPDFAVSVTNLLESWSQYD